jgi:hypothetical protein
MNGTTISSTAFPGDRCVPKRVMKLDDDHKSRESKMNGMIPTDDLLRTAIRGELCRNV